MAIAAIATVIYGFGNLYQPTVVVGESMSPTLHSGKLIWIDRTYYRSHTPREGEVVVFRHDGETYVKRVFRGPGEKMHYLACDSEWLEPVREQDYPELLKHYSDPRSALRVRETIIPDDSIFVLGDNFRQSMDSRQLGPIPISEIVGRAHLEADPDQAQRYAFIPVRHRARPASPARPSFMPVAHTIMRPEQAAGVAALPAHPL